MKIKYKKSLVWIRRDMRLADHTALNHATRNSDSVAVAFVFDTEILKDLKNKADRRVTFIYDSLREIDVDLRKYGSKLIVRFGNPVLEIPKLIKELNAEALYFNEDYEPYAIMRDQKIQESLKKSAVPSYCSKDHVIFSGKEVLKPNRTPYQMFTPYKRAWIKKLRNKDYEVQKVMKNFIQFSNSESDLQ